MEYLKIPSKCHIVEVACAKEEEIELFRSLIKNDPRNPLLRELHERRQNALVWLDELALEEGEKVYWARLVYKPWQTVEHGFVADSIPYKSRERAIFSLFLEENKKIFITGKTKETKEFSDKNNDVLIDKLASLTYGQFKVVIDWS